MKYILMFLLICITELSTAKSPEILPNNLTMTAMAAEPISPFVYPPGHSDRGRREINAATVAAYILAYSGGFMIGYTLGTAIAGGDPNWAVAGVGAGLIGIAVPLSIIGKKHGERYATGVTNDKLIRSQLSIVAGPASTGLRLRF